MLFIVWLDVVDQTLLTIPLTFLGLLYVLYGSLLKFRIIFNDMYSNLLRGFAVLLPDSSFDLPVDSLMIVDFPTPL